MGEISGDARGVDNIVERKLVNERAGLEKERQRLGECQRMVIVWENGICC